MAGTDAIPDVVLSHLLREQEAAKDASACANATNWSILRRPCLPWGTRQMRSRVRQNAESVGLDPGANTVHLICRPPDTTAIPT